MNLATKHIFSILLLLISTATHSQTTIPNPACSVGNSAVNISEGNFSARLMNAGDMFWDPGLGVAGFKWPKNQVNNTNLTFASGFWLSGIDQSTGQIMTAVQTYRGNLRNYWPGPLVRNVARTKQECNFWDQHFKVTRADLDTFFLQSFPAPSNLIPMPILKWPGKGNQYLKDAAVLLLNNNMAAFDQNLAPFVDANGDGIYNPLVGDYPDLGNRLSMVWWVMNDAGATKNYSQNTSTVPAAGLEFQVLASVYPNSGGHNYLENCLFMDLKVINKGNYNLDSCFIGFWSDFDLGNGGDDYVQCHVQKNLSIAFNGDNLDEGLTGYGLNPPALALKILDGPKAYPNDGLDNNRNGIVDEPGEKTLFSSFVYYNLGSNPRNGDPSKYTDFYNYLRSRWIDGTMFSYGETGLNPVSSLNPATRFMYPGASDPIGYGLGGTPQNPKPMPPWTEESANNAPGDRRALMTAGPFRLVPDSSFHYTFTTLIARVGNNLDNLNHLSVLSDSLDAYYPIISSIPTKKKPNISHFKLFPNPTSGAFSINSDRHIDNVMVSDLQGKILIHSIGKEEKYNLKGLKPGIYMISISGEGILEKQKLIVQ